MSSQIRILQTQNIPFLLDPASEMPKSFDGTYYNRAECRRILRVHYQILSAGPEWHTYSKKSQVGFC